VHIGKHDDGSILVNQDNVLVARASVVKDFVVLIDDQIKFDILMSVLLYCVRIGEHISYLNVFVLETLRSWCVLLPYRPMFDLYLNKPLMSGHRIL
jgi:hypothetical protein